MNYVNHTTRTAGQGRGATGRTSSFMATTTGRLPLTLRERRDIEDAQDKQLRNEQIKDAMTEWVEHFATWSAFWTLTFESAKFGDGVTRQKAESLWRRLVQRLNVDLFGSHYVRIVGHSYFAYALGFEPHKSGILHMHALTDHRTHWALAHQFWQGPERPFHIGIIDIEPVTDLRGSAAYVTKYATKGGDVTLFRPDKLKEPSFKPLWYMSNQFEKGATN